MDPGCGGELKSGHGRLDHEGQGLKRPSLGVEEYAGFGPAGWAWIGSVGGLGRPNVVFWQECPSARPRLHEA